MPRARLALSRLPTLTWLTRGLALSRLPLTRLTGSRLIFAWLRAWLTFPRLSRTRLALARLRSGLPVTWLALAGLCPRLPLSGLAFARLPLIRLRSGLPGFALTWLAALGLSGLRLLGCRLLSFGEDLLSLLQLLRGLSDLRSQITGNRRRLAGLIGLRRPTLR